MEMNARSTQVVHSGKYLMKISAICTHVKMRNVCWRTNGPFQWMHTIPSMPKFHNTTETVIISVTKLNCLKNSLNNVINEQKWIQALYGKVKLPVSKYLKIVHTWQTCMWKGRGAWERKKLASRVWTCSIGNGRAQWVRRSWISRTRWKWTRWQRTSTA